jgi:hypothetical protein
MLNDKRWLAPSSMCRGDLRARSGCDIRTDPRMALGRWVRRPFSPTTRHHVQVLKVRIGLAGTLTTGNGGVDMGATAAMVLMGLGAHLQRRQRSRVRPRSRALQVAVQAPGMVLYGVLFEAPSGMRFLQV